MNRTDAVMQRRAGAFFAALALMLALLAARLVQINTTMAPKLRLLAARQRTSHIEIPARRGHIFDRRGRVLAGSRMRPSIYADPSLVEDPTSTATSIGEVLGVEPGIIENEIRSSSAPRFCWLARRIEPVEAEVVLRLKLPGIGSTDEFARDWPMGSLAAHVIGFTSRDGRGLAGVERVLDAHLRAHDGSQRIIRDAGRNVLGSVGPVDAPIDGGHVLLTIDAVIQEIVEHQLSEGLNRFEAESAVAIVMRPATGEVLAMACAPTFDPASPTQVEFGWTRNRALTDPVEPGSVFKPFIMAKAMEGGFVERDEEFDCHLGEHAFGNRIIHDTSKQSILTPTGILVYSSNIGMGQIGERMGNARLRGALTAFGFGESTQIGLPGESKGLIPELRRWTRYSTTSVPMGQEIAVTPMQLITAFSAIVNDGVLLRPRIIKAHLGADGSVIRKFDKPEIVRRAVDSDVAHYLTSEALPAVIARHSPHLDPEPFRMLGKTGTAQVPFVDRRGYEPGAYLSSFIGAAPVDDPQIAMLVMIRKPNPVIGYYGSKVAGPIGRDIARAVLDYLRAPVSANIASADGDF